MKTDTVRRGRVSIDFRRIVNIIHLLDMAAQMNLLKLAVMITGVVIGIATGHILWGFWGGIVAGLVVLAAERRKSTTPQ